MPKTAIIGGGAAGFFAAIRLKELCPSMDVTILERAERVLRKVEISGGGRCNCTNTFAAVTDLSQVYPRGHKLLKRLFRQFGPKDAFDWFQTHGVPLTIQEDQCVFPQAQDSHAIINCFLRECNRHKVRIETGHTVESAESLLQHFDHVVCCIGGTPSAPGCVPSLFTFNIPDKDLHSLMGLVVENAITSIPGTKFRTQGALLITHWGMSGPAILKLSSHAARHLAESSYKAPLAVNWTGESNAEEVRESLTTLLQDSQGKLIDNMHPFNLQSRLWIYLLQKTGVQGRRISELGKKQLNRLTEVLTNDQYKISSRCHYKEEFVTCGGIALTDINPNTLESRLTPNLYYAGEVLDIDGVTGGFNLQAAWTTADTVARAIAANYEL